MDKIKCPHCGAINQDVTPQDACWNCGKPLGAKAAAPAPTTPAANVSEAQTEPVLEAGGQKLKAQPTLEERVAVRKSERLAARRTNPAVYILLVLFFILLAVILYFVFVRPH